MPRTRVRHRSIGRPLSRTSRPFFAAVAVACAALAACGDDGSDAPAPIDFAVCATQHEISEGGVRLLACDEAFAEAPLVRLPADVRVEGGESTLYVGFNPIGDHGQLIARDGTGYDLYDDQGPITGDLAARMPRGLDHGSYRFLYRIYEVKGVVTQRQGDLGTINAIEVSAARPIVSVSSDLLDSRLLGVWEGTVSQRTGDNTYDEERRAKVRIEITGLGEARGLLEWGDPDVFLDGHAMHTPTGTIVNADAAVTLSDGSCAPSLASLGEGNPFGEATSATIRLYRFPAMHRPGDYQTVFDYPSGSSLGSGMGAWLPASPAALIQTTPTDFNTPALTFGVHSAPNGFHLILDRAPAAGGEPCVD